MSETDPLLRSRSNDQAIIDDPQEEEDAFQDAEFQSEGCFDNPMNWPRSYKWGVIALLAFMAFTVTFTCIGVVPVAGRIVLDLEGRESKSSSVLLVTIWELGEAAGPLIIAPLSEVYGRYPIFNAANILFILWTLVAASSQTSWLFILSRFLTGCAVASNVLNPAIIGDMLPPEQRGTAMATLMIAPLLGGAVGPAIAGAIAQSIGWRRILWLGAGIATICELVFSLTLRETYKITILKTRLKKERRASYVSVVNPEKESATKTIWRSIKRPATVFADSLVLQILSLYGCIVFSFFYIMATTLPSVLESEYGFSPASTGSAFLSFSVGSCVGIIVCNLTLDRIYIALKTRNNNIGLPEHRMPLVILSAVLLPLAVLLFGWTAQNHWPVQLLLLSVGLLGFFLLLCMVPLMTYVTDAFGIYSASALTAVLVTRCLMSTFLPLSVVPVTDRLGFGWGFVVFAAVCFGLAPIPLMVMRYGDKWRQRSVYTKDV
ncbi:hypothetical protein FKW77_010266 [Venturia effusa]|uniref:Major facilitator superfamily (MFS) profile domain-containing protein n=1 Tax=Venturia effusa TaxID=50376 RepID=A0A517L6D6_9PEZI|nr:hypothetical protein FKW77_010266 [Venturia effusa]